MAAKALGVFGLCGGLLAAVPATDAADFVPVPGSSGARLHRSCIHEVPHGVVVDDSFDAGCEHIAIWPSVNEQLYAIDVKATGTQPFTQMNSTWTVPALPAKDNEQTVYFWPGFKATQPLPGYPVLQPVLQYGEGFKESWQLQSWFVWARKPIFPMSVTGPAIDVEPGDVITSYMELDPVKEIWTVYGRNERTKDESKLQISKSRAGNTDYAYAMHVLETIMSSTGYCPLYPADPSVTFSGITANGGQPVTWTPEVQKHDCDQKVTFSTAGDTVTMSWGSGDRDVVV